MELAHLLNPQGAYLVATEILAIAAGLLGVLRGTVGLIRSYWELMDERDRRRRRRGRGDGG